MRLGFDFLRFAIHAEVYGDSGFPLFDFVHLGAGVEGDAAFAIDPRQLFGDFFIFNWNQPGQHFDESDFGAEGTEDGSEFDAHRSCANNHQRFGNLLERENLDVGQDAVARLETWQHTRFRTGTEDHVLRFDLRGFAVGGDLDGEHSVLRRAGQLAVTADGFDFVLLHQKIEALGVLGHDFRFAFLDGGPVEPGGVYAFDAEFLGVFQMVPKFGVKQQGLGGDAAYVQAGTAEHGVLLDESGFQAILAGADGGGVASWTAADDGDVINGFRQEVVLTIKRCGMANV